MSVETGDCEILRDTPAVACDLFQAGNGQRIGCEYETFHSAPASVGDNFSYPVEFVVPQAMDCAFGGHSVLFHAGPVTLFPITNIRKTHRIGDHFDSFASPAHQCFGSQHSSSCIV